MPSPPDVILVLSPRTAKLVRYAVRELAATPELLDFDDDEEFPDMGDAEDAADALAAEITEQLSTERANDVRVELQSGSRRNMPEEASKTDVEQLAGKMAKAARKAVEE
jgi:hypothetical protein